MHIVHRLTLIAQTSFRDQLAKLKSNYVCPYLTMTIIFSYRHRPESAPNAEHLVGADGDVRVVFD